MRIISAAILALLCSVALAREDTAGLCTGALACDAGYCCSSHGFCGRSPLHCSHSTGCNAEKGSCGVVVLDKQDMPRVISYDELGQSTVKNLAKRLTEEGSHVSPDNVKEKVTLETLLEKGVAEREKMLASMPKPVVAAPPVQAPVQPVGSTDSTSKTTDGTMDMNSKDKKSVSSRNTGASVLAAGVVMGVLAFTI